MGQNVKKIFLPIFNSQANCNFFEKNSKLKKKIFLFGMFIPNFLSSYGLYQANFDFFGKPQP